MKRQGFLAAMMLAVCLWLPLPAQAAETARAIFAGGCFWCMESEFDSEAGVVSVTSGYTGGSADTATYKQVSTGATGHIEAVEIVYDPARVTYARLLQIFWRNIDPFDAEGQFCDKGSQYAAGIFYADDAQQAEAEKSRAAMQEKLGKEIKTFIRPAVAFYVAEDYHQEYYKNNARAYKSYRTGCGRDRALEKIWGETAE